MKDTVKFLSLLFTLISFLFIGSCKTEDISDPPVVTTNDYVLDITRNSATVMGTTTKGGSVSEVGICWNTTGNPTLNDFKVSGKNLTGGFSGNLTLLNGHTKYFARAYAVNGGKGFYGNEITFTTEYDITAMLITGVTSTSATVTGNAKDLGSFKEVGICWRINGPPTSIHSKVACNLQPDGSFSANLTGLSPNTHYYVRPYLISEEGTFFGNVLDFKIF